MRAASPSQIRHKRLLVPWLGMGAAQSYDVAIDCIFVRVEKINDGASDS